MSNANLSRKPSRSKALRAYLKSLREHPFISKPILRFLGADLERERCDWEGILQEIAVIPKDKITGIYRRAVIGAQRTLAEWQLFELACFYDPQAPALGKGAKIELRTRDGKFLESPRYAGEVTPKAAIKLQHQLLETIESAKYAPMPPLSKELKHLNEVLRFMFKRRSVPTISHILKPTAKMPVYLDLRDGCACLVLRPAGLDTDLWALLLDFLSTHGWGYVLEWCPCCGRPHAKPRKGSLVSTEYCSKRCSNTMRKRYLRESQTRRAKRFQPS